MSAPFAGPTLPVFPVSVFAIWPHGTNGRAEGMKKKNFALYAITGVMALFGLNEVLPRSVQLTKTAPSGVPEVLALNGQLFSAVQTSPDITSTAMPSPEPTDLPFGVEAVTGGVQARLTANAAARQAILEAAPDPGVLRAYSGTGGLGEDSESVDQFYTPANIGGLMWSLATNHLDLTDEKKPIRALEPSCGNGGLLAQAPAGILLTGVEMDAVAGRAAQHLLPHASVHVMPFESYTTRSSDPLFDVTVLNPPFGVRSLTRDLHQRDEVRSERYFMNQAVRRTKHGGVIVALLPLNVLHGHAHAGWRSEMLRLALPLHAVLIPDGAFRAAGAGVTSCLLVLRRHDYGVASGLSVLSDQELTQALSRFCMDSLHKTFVEQFVGGAGLVTTQEAAGQVTYDLRYATPAWHLSRGATFTQGRFGQPAFSGEVRIQAEAVLSQLADAMKATPVTLHLMTETVRDLAGDKLTAFQKAASEEELFPIAEGQVSTDRKFVFRLGAWEASDDFADPVIFQATQLAQSLESYLYAEHLGRPEAAQRRRVVESQHAAYLRSHGAVPRQRLLRLSGKYPLFALLLAHVGEGSELRLPEAKETRLPVQGQDLPTVAGELSDLLALTEDTLMEYAGVSREAAREHLKENYAFNGQVWVERGLYYAGHAFLRSDAVRAQAQAHQGYEREALLWQADEFMRRVRYTKIEDLKLSPRDPILPTEVLEAWVNAWVVGEDAEEKGTGGEANAEDAAHLISAVRERGAVKLGLRAGAGQGLAQLRTQVDTAKLRGLEKFLNHRTEVASIRGQKDMSDDEYLAAKTVAIEEARSYEADVTRHFQKWLPESRFVQAVEQAYVWARGAVLRPEGSVRPLNITGYQGKPPHPYQLSDARSMAMSQGMINAYDVGLGKTLEMLILIGYLKMCGKASRPIISVPAGLVSNWATNAREAYPEWNIVTVGMSVRRDKNGNVVYKRKADGSYMLKDGKRIEAWVKDSASVKRAKIASLAAGNVDLIIMSRNALTDLGMMRETRQQLITSDPQYLRDLETEQTGEKSTGMRRGRHQELTRQLGAFGAMMSNVKIAGPGELAFEVLGCDFLGNDEGHELKNSYNTPDIFGEQPKFIGSGGNAQRAIDAIHKGSFVRAQGGHTYNFTASWVKNSPLEVYTMLRTVTDDLPHFGLPTMEAMMEQYLKIEPEIITEQDGSISVKPCVTGFRRLGELRQIIRSFVISRTYGDPEVITSSGEALSVPKADIEEVMIDMSSEQAAAYSVLRQRARYADARKKGPDHPFSIMWDMRKLTIDPVLQKVSGPNPRFEKIAELALENRRENGKCIVFLSTGERQGSFERLKETLIKAGYPSHEIAIVSSHTHKTSVERQDLEDDYNYGDLTLILGTDVLGQGFNLQVGTSMIINADMPWTPEDLRQRVGRGARQGNTATKLRNIYLLMRGSFDTLTYTIVSGKQSWLSQLWTEGVDEIENSGREFSGEQLALLMSDNPDQTRSEIAQKKMELEKLTERTNLERKLELIAEAMNARDLLMSHLERAKERKHGVTANDQLKIRNASKIFESRRATALATEHPMSKMVDYQGTKYWFGIVPVHEGMKFTLDDTEFEVRQIMAHGTVLSVDETGNTRSFTGYQVSKARNFQPTSNSSMFSAPEKLKIPELQGQIEKIYVLDGKLGRGLVPKNPEKVITISVKGRAIDLENPSNGLVLQNRLYSDFTIMHFLSEVTADGHYIIKNVAIISNNDTTLKRTRNIIGQPEFQAKLLALAAQAIGGVVQSPQAATAA